MLPYSVITATFGLLVFNLGAVYAQGKSAPDSSEAPHKSTVVIRQSGTGNSATVTQSGGGKATTVVTSTVNGNTTIVRHDGQSSVHVEQSGPVEPAPNQRKAEPGKRKED